MAYWHIDELLVELMGAGWTRVNTLPGTPFGIAGMWKLIQPSTDKVAIVEFHVEYDETNAKANDEILNSYGCAVRYNPNVALHFYNKRNHWDLNLKRFVLEMDELETRVAAADRHVDESKTRESDLVSV